MSVSKQPVSSVSSESDTSGTVTSIDESCGFEIGCGSCKSERYPLSFMQSFATSRWALVFFSLGALIQGYIVNGQTPVVISTLERRFELTSTESGLISSCYDIAGSITILFVTYVGGHGHKPLWIGWGIFLIGLSGIMFSLPHFTAPYYSAVEISNFCSNPATETCAISALKDFRFVFYGALLLAGVGASPLYSLAITYLDENVKQRYSSMYNGILIAFSIIGPGIGYLVGAAFLRIYTYPNESVAIDSSSESWVGAWWIGSLLIGIIGVFASIPTLMLPKVIPGTEKHRESRRKELHVKSLEDNKDPVFGRRFRDFPKVTLQLFRNPTYVFESFGIALDSLLIGGLGTFGPKYIETQFGLDASSAGTYFGLMAILGGAGGQIIGGALISKFNISIRSMLHICYIAPLLSAFCAACYFITCSTAMMAGVSVSYHDGEVLSDIQLLSDCNQNCGCNLGIYNPVCGTDGLSYFSPCFAGCSGLENGVFTNCTCVTATTNGTPFTVSPLSTAARGGCIDEQCSDGWQLIVFCIFNFLIMFLTFFNEAAALQVSLRCVPFKRRSFAIGVQVLIWRVFGTIPGPLVIGAIFDSTCRHWTEQCGTRGSCIFYDNVQLSLYVFLFIAICKIVDCILFIGGLLTYKPVPDSLPPSSDSDDIISSSSGDSADKTKKPNKKTVLDKISLPGEVLSDDTLTPKESFVNSAFSNDEGKETQQ